jgi:hypothetical protein
LGSQPPAHPASILGIDIAKLAFEVTFFADDHAKMQNRGETEGQQDRDEIAEK